MPRGRLGADGQARELGLIKDNVPADDELFGQGVVHLVPLVAGFEADIDALDRVRCEVIALVFPNVHVGSAAEDTEKREIWLLTSKRLDSVAH